MTWFGVPSAWLDLIGTLVPDILDLVDATWRAMPTLEDDAREDPTTEALCRRLRQNRNAANLPFRIDIQMVELGETADVNQGRMDIVFSPMVPTEEIYFCLECKRLNVTKSGSFRTYASEYVVHGMLRFVTGHYAAAVKEGGMLGYVLDGNAHSAIDGVAANVRRRRRELCMEPPGTMHVSTIRPADDLARETRHDRRRGEGQFVIHHIFAPAPRK